MRFACSISTPLLAQIFEEQKIPVKPLSFPSLALSANHLPSQPTPKLGLSSPVPGLLGTMGPQTGGEDL